MAEFNRKKWQNRDTMLFLSRNLKDYKVEKIDHVGCNGDVTVVEGTCYIFSNKYVFHVKMLPSGKSITVARYEKDMSRAGFATEWAIETIAEMRTEHLIYNYETSFLA